MEATTMEKVKSTTGQVHIIDPHRKAAKDDRPLTLCMSKVTGKWTATVDGVTCPHCRRIAGWLS